MVTRRRDDGRRVSGRKESEEVDAEEWKPREEKRKALSTTSPRRERLGGWTSSLATSKGRQGERKGKENARRTSSLTHDNTLQLNTSPKMCANFSSTTHHTTLLFFSLVAHSRNSSATLCLVSGSSLQIGGPQAK
jgi:hypothetical protein